MSVRACVHVHVCACVCMCMCLCLCMSAPHTCVAVDMHVCLYLYELHGGGCGCSQIVTKYANGRKMKQGGYSVQVQLAPTDSEPIDADIQDHMDGTYTATYIPRLAGEAQALSVSFIGQVEALSAFVELFCVPYL